MITPKKPLRTLGQQVTNQGFTKPSLYSVSGLINFGSESNANFVDVVSVGPITSIDKIYINDTDIETGEFPLSEFYPHTGETETTPFEGNFPYVERAYSINKQADLVEGDDDTSTKTVFKRSVSGVGVAGVRISFTAPQFTHKDNKNRRKRAQAIFKLHLLDESGNRVKTETADTPYFYSSDPISVQITVLARDEDLQRVWDYEVEMDILNNYYRTVVTGNWTASIATELYRDTQTYKDVAMVSGKVVSSDVSGSTPKREYLVKGYKVDVPIYSGPNQTFLGQFEKATSNSHAWNAMAVMVDEKWGAGLPLDKINIADFVEFDKYVSEILPDGSQRYKHSQELLKADNYFRIASQIVGAADGKLYEDTSGRIGILIDRQTDKRRVITSYDIQNEKVKRTTVPDKKKTNYVEMEFSDETNNYQKNIISVQDDAAIVRNGLISEKLKSDTCTNPSEALRTIKKVLANSQIATSTYVFTVGHTHEDVQIGEVVALYDRKYSRVNYCGKVASGSSLTEILVDKRTPISLDGITNPQLVLDNSREVPITAPILSWTDSSITLSAPLLSVPEEFTSFAVESSDQLGLKPTLMRVMGVDDKQGVLQLECIEYNDSLQNYLENDGELIEPPDRLIPEPFEELTGLSVSRVGDDLVGSWDASVTNNYVYYWKKYINSSDNTGVVVSSGQTDSETVTLSAPLDPAKYSLFVYIFDTNTAESSSVKRVDITLGIAENDQSLITPPDNLGIETDNAIRATQYSGKDFTLAWDQDISTGEPSGYLLRILQDGLILEYTLSGEDRLKNVPSTDLEETFGSDYDRDFIISLIAFDGNLDSANPAVININNPAPVAPIVEIQVTGDINLETQLGNPLEEDIVGSIIYLWKSTNPSSPRPIDALEIRTNEVSEINIPDDAIDYDGSTYVYEAAWVDTFGEQGLVYGRDSFTFDPDLLVPVPPSLERVIPINNTTVRVEFTHDGTWLRRMKAFYRRYGSSDEWVQVANIYTFPVPVGETDRGFDANIGEGFINISGLAFNTEFEFKVQVANIASAYSDDSDVVNGAPATFIDTEDLEDFLGSLDPRDLIVEGTTDVFGDDILNKSIVEEAVQRKSDTEDLVARISRIRSDFETANSVANAAITDLSTVLTNENEAIARQVQLLEANFNDNFAAISSISQALASETESKVAKLNQLTAKLVTESEERIADFQEATVAIANEGLVRSQQVTELSAEISEEGETRKAAVQEVSDAIVTEETIRSQQFTQLTAADTANANEIATVAENAVAAIGYCTIGGNPASQGDKSSCELAGGVWTEAPLAEAVRQTQVTSGSESSTVGSHYQSFVSLNGELVGKATLGVNVSGVFTGLSIIGGSNLSSITFQGDTFKIKDTSGTDALYWSATDSEWKFNGGGTFTGTLSAPTVNGGTFNGGNFIGNVFTGGQFVTASGTASRVDINDDGTYLIWAGSGTKIDSNATFFIKKNGTGFVSGSFFAGQIIETNFNQGITSASITHNSAGNDVELTITSNGSGTVIAGSAPSPVGASTYNVAYSVTRGGSVIETGSIPVTRIVEFEVAENEYTTRDFYNFSTTIVDTTTASAAYTYAVTIGNIQLSSPTQKVSIRSYEDLLTS